MKPASAMRLLLVPAMVLASSGRVWAQGNACETSIGARLQKITESVKKLQDAAQALLHKKGRASRAKIEQLLAAKWDEVKQTNANDPAAAHDEVAQKWEDSLLERTNRLNQADYPTVEELLAFAAFKSPTFDQATMEFLNNRGSIRYQVLAQFMESFNERIGYSSKAETNGAHFWNLWRARISLPARRLWTSDDIHLFITEAGSAVFRGLNPEPKFRSMWLSSVWRVANDRDNLKIWQVFAKQFTEDYRARYAEFLKGVSLEAFGTPRPEVIRDFMRWGPWDTIYRRLAAIKLLASRGNAKVLAQYGLTPEDADSIYRGLLYDKLPRTFKNAAIIANHPEMYADVLFSAEAQQLSLELMFFSRPVIEGLMLYYMYFDPLWDAYQGYEQNKKKVETLRQNPNILRQSKQADDDKTSNYDDQINNLAIEVLTWRKELDSTPGMPADERARREKDIRVANKRIQTLNMLKQKIREGITKPQQAS